MVTIEKLITANNFKEECEWKYQYDQKNKLLDAKRKDEGSDVHEKVNNK